MHLLVLKIWGRVKWETMKETGHEEVEYKQKSGTAWSHSYLNQKPWHPLSYPNQRRKWIAEQQNAQKSRMAEEVAHEFAQQQEFFRQTAEMSKREKEKVEALQAVGFMYMRPPGYNAESARAAEIADERKMLGLDAPPSFSLDASLAAAPGGSFGSEVVVRNSGDLFGGNMITCGVEAEVKKKPRVKDVFGRNVATEEEFAVLKDAPKMDTGVVGRVKPFAIEIRNVKCAKCGGFGHQSGDRECPLKDVLTPNEIERLKRNDPLNAIIAQATGDEPFKWELKNQPGAISPARGGFRPDDPNQQILADEDIYDEYGGFLTGVGDGDDMDGEGKLSMPDILASFTKVNRKELAALKVGEKRWRKEDRKTWKKRKSRRDPGSDEDNDRKEKRRGYRHRSHKSKRGHCKKQSFSTGTFSASDRFDTTSELRDYSSSKIVLRGSEVDKQVAGHESHCRHRHWSSRCKEGECHSKDRDREKRKAEDTVLDEVH